MAGKINSYDIKAIDTEGEVIIEERITAMTDKAAWTEAVKRSFLKVSEQARQGFLVGRLLSLEVIRI